MELGITGVAAITVLVYGAGQAMRGWKQLERWIPAVSGALGGLLGVLGLFVMPDFPAEDVISAAAIGVVSGLAATGARQAVRQLCSGPDCGNQSQS